MKMASPLAIVAESVEILLISKEVLELQEMKYSSSKTTIEIPGIPFFMIFD
jgi:hypothetical protein